MIDLFGDVSYKKIHFGRFSIRAKEAFWPFFFACMEKVRSRIEPIVREEGLELLDVVWTLDHGRQILRVLLDKEGGGVTVDDCTRVSHAIEDVIEVEELIPRKYDLEVSSPGLNRPLLKPAHFEKVVGKIIRVKTDVPLEGRQNYCGILNRISGDIFFVEIDKKEYAIPFERVDKANLEYTL